MDKSTAILEILLMLLVAFAIGFVIAWLLKKRQSSALIHQLEADNTRHKDRIIALENERAHLVTRSSSLEAELDQCIKSKQEIFYPEEVSTRIAESDRANAEKLGFKPASAAQKDDLKLINGIGPFIEKKLNNLGIYTFEQISEFSPATIDRVTKTIEFFPGRIERDHWVAQAHNILQTKLN